MAVAKGLHHRIDLLYFYYYSVSTMCCAQTTLESLSKHDDNHNDNGRRLLRPSVHALVEITLTLSFPPSVFVR